MPHNIGEMFYFGERPWHTLGRPLGHPADVEEALAAGGLDWAVATVPIVPQGEPGSRIAHRVAVVRTDRAAGEAGRVIGVVHPGFRPLQNRDGARIFDALLGQGNRVYHTGGYLKDGEVVWLLAKLPRDIRVRGNDVLETYLLFTNSHDGSVAIDMRLTTIRVVCQNTLSMALRGADARKAFKRGHDGRYDILKDEARSFFQFAIERSAAAEALFKRLSVIRCSETAFGAWLEELMPDPAPPARAGVSAAVEKGYETRLASVRASRARIREIHGGGIPQQAIPAADPTWWGALNTVTAWVDHVQDTDSDRYAHILFGSGDRMKAAALERVVEVVK